jgi:DNA-binding transcriptional LysR family regulator
MLVLARAVGAGHGVAVLPVRSVAGDAAAVQVRPLRTPQLARRLTAVARASTLARPAVAAVLAAVRSAAGCDDPPV